MKANTGSVDRIIRILIALVITALYFINIISGTLAIVLLALSGVFILTSFISFCPLYTLLGIKRVKNNILNAISTERRNLINSHSPLRFLPEFTLSKAEGVEMTKKKIMFNL